MATDDQQRLVAGQGVAPTSFQVPGNGQIRPKAVRAVYDGTGAGTFIPVLQIVSDAGVPVAECVGAQVAAGGSAAVSWFRGGVAEAVAVSTLGTVPTIFGRITSSPKTVAAGATTPVSWDTATLSDGTNPFGWSALNPSVITCSVGGTYIAAFTLAPWNDWPARASGYIQFYTYNDVSLNEGSQQVFGAYPGVEVFSDQADGPFPVTAFSFTAPNDKANPLQFRIFNNTASPWQYGNGTTFSVARLSDWVSF